MNNNQPTNMESIMDKQSTTTEQLGQAIKVYKITARLTDCKKGVVNGQLAEFLVQKYSFCDAVQFIENHYRDWAYFTVEIVSVEIVTDALLSVDIEICK